LAGKRKKTRTQGGDEKKMVFRLKSKEGKVGAGGAEGYPDSRRRERISVRGVTIGRKLRGRKGERSRRNEG